MRRRSIAFWVSLSVHAGIAAVVVVFSSGDSQAIGAVGSTAAPRTIHLTGRSAERLPGRDMLFEVLNGAGMPIHLTSATGDSAVGLAWWSPSVGLWLALDRLPATPSGRRLDVSLQMGAQRAEPLGTIEVDEQGSGRIVVVWTAERPIAKTPITLTVSEPGSLWRLRPAARVLAGSAPMRN